MGEMLIHGIHHRDLLIQNHIGIIGHTVGNHILAFKKVNLMIVDTHIADIFRNFHFRFFSLFFFLSQG